uniref:Uncharacterized protein n=1 Tax=Pipistrellus kuhlii TaxID=59472 RepID=A0A7J7TXJ7_PIPKU|nr:hypothetical protein mPipKuh1_009209 [Pipistrellus kuhlii]
MGRSRRQRTSGRTMCKERAHLRLCYSPLSLFPGPSIASWASGWTSTSTISQPDDAVGLSKANCQIQAQCLLSWSEHLSPLRLRQEEEEASGGGVGECAFGRHTKGSEGGNMRSSWIYRTSSRATSGKPSRGIATLEATPEPEPDPSPAFTELQETEEPPAAFQHLTQLVPWQTGHPHPHLDTMLKVYVHVIYVHNLL